MDNIRVETFAEYQFVSNPSFAPDGSAVAFIVQYADLKSNRYKGDLYLYLTDSRKVMRLTASGDVKSYVWTRQGTLIFPSERNGKKDGCTVYFEISPLGGEAVQKFEIPLKVTDFCVVDENVYLLKASVKWSETSAAEEKADYQVIDELPFWFNGKGITNGLRTQLYTYDAADGRLTRISEENADVSSYSVRGRQVLYKAYPRTDVRKNYDGIYLYHLDTEEHRCILEKDTRRTGMIGLWTDEEAVVASSVKNPYGDNKYMDFYTLNLNSGEWTLLAEYDYSSGSGSVGSDARLGAGRTVKAGDGICYFITTRGSSAQLYSISKDGTLKAITAEEGSCDSFDIQNGHVVISGLYENKLAELYLDGRQITFLNDMSRWNISIPEAYTFTARDGQELTGWILKPADYEPGRKYPAILNIHGGPRTVYGTIFYHEMQVWAGAGYFVFFTNPRGSDGFGTEFGNISGKYGTVDYEDLMDFTDYILKTVPDIDPARVGVTGGSYGGFMTNWIIGHTDRFRAAVSQRSISNWISFEFMSDIGHNFTKNNQSVTTFEDVEKLWFHSPLQYAPNCKTPTLFLHSDADYRCNVAEGIQMYSALKYLGVETRLCVFRGENHELSRSGKPWNRIGRMKELLNWMNRFLL